MDCNKNEHYPFGYELHIDVQMCGCVDVQIIEMCKCADYKWLLQFAHLHIVSKPIWLSFPGAVKVSYPVYLFQ
jgi:hypothetical protein